MGKETYKNFFIKVLTHYNKTLFGSQGKRVNKVLSFEPIEISLDLFLSLMSICLVILIAFDNTLWWFLSWKVFNEDGK